MASLRPPFEKELKGKLVQKTAGRLTEEGVLMKNFKYFDLDSTGTVGFPEFIKACEKIGIHTFTKDQFKQLFDFYDLDQDGKVDYKEFAGMVFGNASSTTRQMSPQKGGNKWAGDSDDMSKTVDKLKAKLASRGPGGILGLGIQFRIADKDKNRKLDPNEFFYGMRDFGTGYSEDECKKLFGYFDKDGDGTVDFDEFIFTIRGQLNPFRLGLVNQAFDKIDKDHSGTLTVDDLRGVYNAKNHPDVKQGKKTEDQVLNEFLHTFTLVYHYHEIDHDKVTRNEFIEYYSFVSASVDNDQYFELMMNNAWKLNESANRKEEKGWANKYETGNQQGGSTVARSMDFGGGKAAGSKGQEQVKKSGAPPGNRGGAPTYGQTPYGKQDNVSSSSTAKNGPDVDSLMKRIRDKLATRGTKGFIGIQRQFKIMDDDGDHAISFAEFTKAMKQYKIELSDPEARAVFQDFDEDGDGTVSIDEFIRDLRGEMNDFRKGIVMKAFNILDKDGDGVLRVNDIKGTYNARQHPDVKSGKKTEDEVLGEFLETFEMHHGLHANNPKDPNVTQKEFIEYYNHVSASIDNDQYFELMMVNGYKLYNSNPKYKEYAPTNSQKGWATTEETKQNKAYTTAPFGTTEASHDWSTSNRPQTGNEKNKSSASAGVPSWPGQGGKNTNTNSNTSAPQGGSNNGTRNSDALLKVFRDKLAARGTRGIFTIGRMFRILDDDNSRSLDKPKWAKCCKDYRMDMSESESNALFQVFDTDHDGHIDYNEFLVAIRGPINDFRKKFVTLAFKKLDKNGDGEIHMDEIKGIYNAKQHPDVKAGKRTEDEILAEFLETFDIHHAMHTGDHKLNDPAITFEEFLEYYTNVSASIDDDKYWELMMTNAWKLDNQSYGKGWKDDGNMTAARSSNAKFGKY
jgi:Ca2+-binding EF-hand superfamily protein